MLNELDIDKFNLDHENDITFKNHVYGYIGSIDEIMKNMDLSLPVDTRLYQMNPTHMQNSPVYFGETWKPITKLSVPEIVEGMYYISDLGRIVSDSKHRHGIRLLNEVESNTGYLRAFLQTDTGKQRYFSIHRIEMIEFCPVEGFQNLQVNHIDGRKWNNCLWNLEWVTGSENILHAFRTGLKAPSQGPDYLRARAIASLLSQGYSVQATANIIGCHMSSVSSIKNGNSWPALYYEFKLANLNNEYR